MKTISSGPEAHDPLRLSFRQGSLLPPSDVRADSSAVDLGLRFIFERVDGSRKAEHLGVALEGALEDHF